MSSERHGIGNVSVEDSIEILQLYSQQSMYIDSGAAANWARTFTPDGQFRSDTFREPAVGRQELERFAEMASDRAADQAIVQRHYVMPPILHSTASDVVQSEAYLLMLAIKEGETPKMVSSSVLHDTLVKRGGVWMFLDREVHRDDMRR